MNRWTTLLTFTGLILLLAVGCTNPGASNNSNGNPPPNGTANGNDNGGNSIGGNTNNNDNNNQNDNGSGGPTASFPAGRMPQLTGIRITNTGRIESGDDVIAFTGVNSTGEATVQYILASQLDTSPRPIPEANRFDPDSFIVAGDKIILLRDLSTTGRQFALTVFDPLDDSLTPIPNADISIANIPIDPLAPGFITSDLNLVATFNNTGFGRAEGDEVIRVIDVSTTPPQIIRFAVNPESDNISTIAQVLIDAESRTVVVARAVPRKFYVYDIDSPTDPPTEFDVGPLSDLLPVESPFAFDRGLLVYTGRQLNNEAPFLLDVTIDLNTPVSITTDLRGAEGHQLLGNFFGVITDDGALTGTLPDLAATPPDPSGGDATGDTLAIGMTSDGGMQPIWFVGTRGGISTQSTIQFSSGDGVWSNLADPNNPEEALPAGDVHANENGNLLAFRHVTGTQHQIAYINLSDN